VQGIPTFEVEGMQFDALIGRWQGQYWWDSGRWQGEYWWYSRDRPQVAFLLVLHRTWVEKGDFIGSVRDNLDNGMPGDGLIWGTMTDGRLIFTKKMPVKYSRGENGSSIKGVGPHPLIHYDGYWFDADQEFRGSWHMDVPRHVSFNTGFWIARKEFVKAPQVTTRSMEPK
jgi:hypothetical protein